MFGFEAGDGVLLLLALLFAWAVHRHWRWRPKFLDNLKMCAGILFALPILLRLALLSRYPVPVASGADDFGYLLLADTLRHFRLANQPHLLPQFFEQVFILQRPTYSSMFNLGQGLLLAAGMFVGLPWIGVLLTSGALSACVYWMLLGWTSRSWAFAGGLLSVCLFGPLCYWTNCYWGGGLAACAGCLIFGSIPRRQPLLLGSGFAVHLLLRPFESLLLIAALLFFKPWHIRRLSLAAIPICGALALIGLQNKAVTKSWTTLPYQLYRYQYGIPATFTFERNPVPHAALNPEKQADYEIECATHGFEPDSPMRYLHRLLERARFLRFFLFAPLYVPFAVGLWNQRKLAGVLGVVALGSNFYPYFYPHYSAALTGVFLALAVIGLQQLKGAGPPIVALCLVQFSCWFCAYSFAHPTEPTWTFLNGPDPQGRSSVAAQLSRKPGKHLVFVHYTSEHRFSEWVHNDADIDASSVIYANDLGPLEDEQLRSLYKDRDVWFLEPDQEPPALHPYVSQTTPFLDVQ